MNSIKIVAIVCSVLAVLGIGFFVVTEVLIRLSDDTTFHGANIGGGIGMMLGLACLVLSAVFWILYLIKNR